jgi:type IX secretion system PorP/SprF family membrane protein
MKYLFYIVLFLSIKVFCQQTGQYSQFTFNKYGYNPAAAGTNINGNIEAIIGTRQQWVGFKKAPSTNFFSVNYTIKPKRSYKLWHNVGLYMSKEKVGIFRNEGYYLSYTLHLPITKKINMSFGVFGGVRNLAVDRNAISTSDPIYDKTYTNYFFAYPDFIPGIRIYNKKTFLDVSVQQLYKNRQAQGNKQIGNKSKLVPQLYVSFGKKYYLNNSFIIVPAVNVHSSLTNIPSVELNLMAYYLKRVGVGVSIRNKDFISGIFQVRVLKNITAGFSYDYSINKLNAFAPNTVEFMLGITPLIALLGNEKEKHNIVRCPSFDF